MTEPDRPPTAALLLAASAGRGFPTCRWLEPWGPRTVIEHVVDVSQHWPVDARYVVLGAGAEEVLASCDLGDVTALVDPEWEEGPAAWLRVGLDLLTREGRRSPVVVSDAAMPSVSADDVAVLLEAHDPEVAHVTVARYRYAAGPPYVLDPEIWPRLMVREGDADLGLLWQAHPSWVTEVRLDRLPPRRIVTPMDLAELRPAR